MKTMKARGRGVIHPALLRLRSHNKVITLPNNKSMTIKPYGNQNVSHVPLSH